MFYHLLLIIIILKKSPLKISETFQQPYLFINEISTVSNVLEMTNEIHWSW